MRSEGTEDSREGKKLVAGESAAIVDLVEKLHHSRDSGIELHSLDILGDLLDGLVHGAFQSSGIAVGIDQLVLQCPNSLKESGAALDGG